MRVLAVLSLLFLASCGTIMDLGGSASTPAGRIYGGVRTDYDVVFVGRCKMDFLAPFFFFDFPLSAAFDTVLLPFTALRALTAEDASR